MKKRTFFQGLQGKLLLYFLLMSLVPLLVVSIVSYQKAQKSLQNTTRDMLLDMASVIEAKVETKLGDRFDDIKAWATMPDLVEAVKTKKYAAASEKLSALVKAYDDYKVVMVFDADGNFVAASDQAILKDSTVDRNQSNREWFKKAMAGEVFVEDVNYSSTVKDTVIGFSAPIKSGGATVGVISSRMSWGIVQKMVEEQKDGATGHAFIINREGLVISHPKKDKVLKENLAKSSDPLMVAFAQKLAKGEEAFADVTWDGVDLEIQVVPAKGSGDFTGGGWAYAMAMADDEIYAPILALRFMVMVIILVTVAIVAVLAVIVARSLANPMIKGVVFAQAVAAGDLSQTLEVRAKDEVGDLANALNAMVESLRNIVGKIRDSSGQVASASEEISAGSAQLNRAAHSQASAAEETSATMVQMAASIQTVAGNA
ncbi:methyl-accepting chemotaxis protein, partial [Geomobilimonas luticola]